jgi:hypothetical protein
VVSGNITTQPKTRRAGNANEKSIHSLVSTVSSHFQNDRKKFKNPVSFSFLDEFEGGGFFHGSVEVVKVGINVMTSARNHLQM